MDDVQLIDEALAHGRPDSPEAKKLRVGIDELQKSYADIRKMLRGNTVLGFGGHPAASHLPEKVTRFMERHHSSRDVARAMYEELASIRDVTETKVDTSVLTKFEQATNAVLALAKQVYHEAITPAKPQRDTIASTPNDPSGTARRGATSTQPDRGVSPVNVSAPAASAPSVEVFQRSLSVARSQLDAITKEVDTVLRRTERDSAEALRQAQGDQRKLAAKVQELEVGLSESSQQHDLFVKAMRTDIIQLLDSAFPLWNSAFQERQVGTGALNTPSAGRRESGQDFVTVSANTMVKHLLTILRDHFGLTRIVVSNRDKFDSSTMTIVQVEPTDDPYFDQCVAREVKWGYRTASGATFRPAEVHVFRLRSGK